MSGAKMGRPSLRDQVVAALPGTRADLANITGVSSATVGKWLSILRAENAVHVGDWRRSHRGSKQPVFVPGAGQDAPEPPTLTQADWTARYNERHPEGRAAIRRRYYYRLRQKSAKRAGWFAALVFTPTQRY